MLGRAHAADLDQWVHPKPSRRIGQALLVVILWCHILYRVQRTILVSTACYRRICVRMIFTRVRLGVVVRLHLANDLTPSITKHGGIVLRSLERPRLGELGYQILPSIRGSSQRGISNDNIP